MHLGVISVRYELGKTWFDGELHVSDGSGGPDRSIRIYGTDTVVALRDFLNSLDLNGRRFTVVT